MKRMRVRITFVVLLAIGLAFVNCPEPDNKSSGGDKGLYADLFDTAKGFPAELSNCWKIYGQRNALITQGFGADPTVFVYNDRVYLFASNDSLMYDADGKVIQMTYADGIQGLRAISSADLANWTDHGLINVGNTPASTNTLDPYGPRVTSYDTRAWAPSAVWKKINGQDKFFIYFANSGNGIGVITADNPAGPWTSPLNKLLIDRDTPTCQAVTDAEDKEIIDPTGVYWLFDPGAMVDNDGQGYIFFGGGNKGDNNARRVKLGDNMISLDEEPQRWGPPEGLFEDNEIVKINNKYYYSYCKNGGMIAYMASDAPFGTYSAAKDILRSPQSQLGTPDQNNHHCIFQFKGDTYIAYHASSVSPAMGTTFRYRSSHINRVNINSDGDISPITMNRTGVPQKGNFNPYALNEAETIGIMGGIFTRADSEAGNGMLVTAIDSGDWVAVYKADFSAGDSGGAKKFTARVRMPETPADYVGAIELRLDPEREGEAAALTTGKTTRIKGGEVIGRVKFEGSAGEFTEVTIDLYKTVTGTHDLVFVFYSSLGAKPITAANMKESHHKNGFEFDQWQFK